jgi:hypothetical protein
MRSRLLPLRSTFSIDPARRRQRRRALPGQGNEEIEVAFVAVK